MQTNSRVLIVLVLSVVGLSVGGAEPTATEFSRAVVQIESQINPQGRTVERLGLQRNGSAIVIDSNGLLVTAGYLVLEAQTVMVTFSNGDNAEARVVANDHSSGLALLRTSLPQGIVPMALGDSGSIGVDEDVVVLNYGGTERAHVATVADIREFAGSWEYLIDRAFYTVPETRNFSGAALLNRDAGLVGVGSLLLSDIFAGVSRSPRSGNLFIPIEHLTASLGTMLSDPSTTHSRPWIGVTLNESQPDITVVRVAQESPAERSGLQPEDTLIALNNKRVVSMSGFYEALWDAGEAGVAVELLIARNQQIRKLTLDTISREQWLHE